MNFPTLDRIAGFARPVCGSRWMHSLISARTLGTAAAGGALAAYAHVPLPWMIGSMIASSILSWIVQVEVWPWLRPLALVILGLALGQSFTAPIISALVGALPAVIFGGILTIVAGVFVARLFVWIAKTEMKTGYYCAVPGGVIVMAIQAAKGGADVASVTFTQSIRLLLVVLIFPPVLAVFSSAESAWHIETTVAFHPLALMAMVLVGTLIVLIARQLRFANPWMIFPCFLAIALSAFDQLPSSVPVQLVDFSQIVLGATLGGRMTPAFLRRSWRLLSASIISTLVLSAVLMALSLSVAWVSGLPVAAVMLGMAPGGMPEMTVTARVLDVGVPLVMSFHLTRLVLSNLLIEPIWKCAQRLGIA